MVLLLVFAAAIAVNLGRGRTAPCHCFGRLHTAPTGPSTLIRTGVLAALASAVVAGRRAAVGGDPLAWAAAAARAEPVAAGLGLLLLAMLAGATAAFTALLAQNGVVRAGSALRARDQVGLRALDDALKGAFDTPWRAGFAAGDRPSNRPPVVTDPVADVARSTGHAARTLSRNGGRRSGR